MLKKLQTVTLGCSKNKVDTEHILSHVEDLYEVIPEGEDIPVDVLLLNTCGFIGDAKEESIQAVLEAVDRKARGEVGKVIVFGCLSQRYGHELPDLIPEVDAWFGAREFDPVIRALGVEPDRSKDAERYLTTPSHYAYLKISEGCDRRCSYCAIPFIRGAHKSVPMEQKPFSIGVRIEHPQVWIDKAQYGDPALAKVLGPAEYKLNHHCENGRGVYTFCMCPGGYVVNASSEEGRLAVNGMSYSGRDGKNANSAILVSVSPEDFGVDGPLAGVVLRI